MARGAGSTNCQLLSTGRTIPLDSWCFMRIKSLFMSCVGPQENYFVWERAAFRAPIIARWTPRMEAITSTKPSIESGVMLCPKKIQPRINAVTGLSGPRDAMTAGGSFESP